jgi:hypothetical protein
MAPVSKKTEKQPDDPVPAYLDPAITPPVDQEQHLKQTDVATAILRAKLTLSGGDGSWPGGMILERLELADEVLRTTGYFRLRYEELMVTGPERI